MQHTNEQDFTIDFSSINNDPKFSKLNKALGGSASFGSQTSFNQVCRSILAAWKQAFATPLGKTQKFSSFIKRISAGGPEIIKTPWGGVVVSKYEHPHVEKHLVIKQGGYLALEKHEKKIEDLEVQEGAGLLIYRHGSRPLDLSAKVLIPGAKAHFDPGFEHCIIGCEDLLVFETSEDPKGMDQDLIFIYTPA